MTPLFAPTVTNSMARCIPDTIPERLYVKSEARLSECLRQELPDDCVLLHSLNNPGKRAGSDVDSDFVLLHSKCRLVLEVKGVGFEYAERGLVYEQLQGASRNHPAFPPGPLQLVRHLRPPEEHLRPGFLRS